MADKELTVIISGAALSFLFYENVRSDGDQMGFLLGDILTYVTQNETDAENQVKSVKTHVDIQSIISCPPTDVMYDSNGKIQIGKIKLYLKNEAKRIVGWFRFRKNFSLVPTLRDKIIHKQLAELFPVGENFVACIMNSSSSSKHGTLKFRHVFLNYQMGQYVPIPLRINNLGNDPSKQEESDYKIQPDNLESKEPDVFMKFVNQLKLDLSRTTGLKAVNLIQTAAERHLESLVDEVCETDREIMELERQILDMKEKMNNKRLSKTSISSPIERKPLLEQESIDDIKFLKTKQSTSNNLEDSDNSRRNDTSINTRRRDKGSFSQNVSTDSARAQTATYQRRTAGKKNPRGGSDSNI